MRYVSIPQRCAILRNMYILMFYMSCILIHLCICNSIVSAGNTIGTTSTTRLYRHVHQNTLLVDCSLWLRELVVFQRHHRINRIVFRILYPCNRNCWRGYHRRRRSCRALGEQVRSNRCHFHQLWNCVQTPPSMGIVFYSLKIIFFVGAWI